MNKPLAAKNKKNTTTLILLGLVLVFIAGYFLWAQTKKDAYDPDIDPKNFSEEVNNKYFTLTPGKTFVYEGATDEGKERIEVTTLDKTKKVMGVETSVVWDRVWLDGELIENTKDWFAQDKEGNVWYFGEDTKDYENGKVVSTEGSWEAGVDGAKPGIVMKADPKVGDEYRQEYYKGVAEDMGKVVALDKTVKVSAGTYDNCLKTKDWTPLEPGADETKYYSPSVGGVVLEQAVADDEKVELVGVTIE